MTWTWSDLFRLLLGYLILLLGFFLAAVFLPGDLVGRSSSGNTVLAQPPTVEYLTTSHPRMLEVCTRTILETRAPPLESQLRVVQITCPPRPDRAAARATSALRHHLWPRMQTGSVAVDDVGGCDSRTTAPRHQP